MSEGVKYDNDKPRWGLLPFKQVEQVVDVLTFGSKKYADDNWKKVPNAQERYFDAMHRHIAEYRYGEKLDAETKKSHLAHAICCALFQMWFDDNDVPVSNNGTVFVDPASENKEVPDPLENLSFNVKPTDLPNYYGKSNPFADATFIHNPNKLIGSGDDCEGGEDCECQLSDMDVEQLNKDFYFATPKDGVLHNIEQQIEYEEKLVDCIELKPSEYPAYCYYGSLCPPFKFMVINNEVKCFE